MSFNKSVQKIFFMLAISISVVLLCLVGVWAATMNLNFHGKVSPDIHCKIVVNNATPIFDNSGSMDTQISSGNTLKDLNIQLSGDVTTAVTFQLTNYTPNKYIRLSVASISGATIKSGDVAVCPPASQSTTPQTMTIHIAGASQASATINLKVEAVYKVTVSGNGLATGAGAHFFAPTDDRTITLEPSVGYQLPESLEIANSSHGEYRTNNTTGTVTINKTDLLGNDVAITANCNQIFAVKESNSQTLGTAGDSFTIANDTTYLPNNGHYTYNNDSTTSGTLDNNFVEYPFYVEMGMYPQKTEVPSGTPSLDTKTGNYVLGDKTYAKINDTYYLFEPIKWIVLEVLDINGDNVDFDDVYCVNDMLCTDPAGGKPFKGELVLMSAHIIDAGAFHSDKTHSLFGDSTVINTLWNTISPLATSNNYGVKMSNASYFGDPTNNIQQYISTKTLYSYGYDSQGIVANQSTPSFFLLAGGDPTKYQSSKDEQYYIEDYFELDDGFSLEYNVGIASATDYAAAKNPKLERGEYTAADGQDPIPAAANRGWGLEAITQADVNANRTLSSAYWTRSGSMPTGAYAVSMNVYKIEVDSDDTLGLRPCMVLDLDFYHTKTFQATQALSE